MVGDGGRDGRDFFSPSWTSALVNVSMPHMMGNFGQTLSAITWVATSLQHCRNAHDHDGRGALVKRGQPTLPVFAI